MDIKPENILLIADLGLAKVFALERPGTIYPYNPTCTFNCLSQALYTTNELCQRLPLAAAMASQWTSGHYALRCTRCSWRGYVIFDGRVLINFSSGAQPPFVAEDGYSMADAIIVLKPVFPYDFNPEAKDLLQMVCPCLTLVPFRSNTLTFAPML
jgi:hypothetical protein